MARHSPAQWGEPSVLGAECSQKGLPLTRGTLRVCGESDAKSFIGVYVCEKERILWHVKDTEKGEKEKEKDMRVEEEGQR